jgi:hypothetical protein
MKDDALTPLSDQLVAITGRLQELERRQIAGQVMSDNKTGNQTANQTVGGGLKSKTGG